MCTKIWNLFSINFLQIFTVCKIIVTYSLKLWRVHIDKCWWCKNIFSTCIMHGIRNIEINDTGALKITAVKLSELFTKINRMKHCAVFKWTADTADIRHYFITQITAAWKSIYKCSSTNSSYMLKSSEIFKAMVYFLYSIRQNNRSDLRVGKSIFPNLNRCNSIDFFRNNYILLVGIKGCYNTKNIYFEILFGSIVQNRIMTRLYIT